MRGTFRGTVVLLCLMTAACISHEKTGDGAAAVGDWKTAVLAYREALRSDPSSPQLKGKYQNAVREAQVELIRKAQACAKVQNWFCVVAETEDALTLDPANPELMAMREDAGRSLARVMLQRAREHAAERRFPDALGQVKRAASTTGDAQVQQEVAQTRAEVVALGDAEAERLRQAKAYPEALALLRLLAGVEGSRQERIQAVEAEQARYVDAEYERLAGEGDVALASRQWTEARTKYEAALSLKAGGRAEPLARYTGGLEQAEQGLARADFAAAEAGFRQAVESGLDKDGAAAQQLERVAVRPYFIRIRTLLTTPLRPGGQPWAGPASPWLRRLMVREASGGVQPFIEAATRLPPRNRPWLSVVAALPEGDRLMTPPAEGTHVSYGSSFVVMTNHYDARKVGFRVVHGEDEALEDVGVVSIPLGELVSRQLLTLRGGAVVALDVVAEPAPGQVEGSFQTMRPHPDGTNLAPDLSLPTDRTRGFRLVNVQVGVGARDFLDEGGTDGPPELYVEIEQGQRLVYQGPPGQNQYQSAWSPSAVTLHLEETEQLVVRVWEADPLDHDLVLTTTVPAGAVAAGAFQTKSPTGSYLDLRFEPRGPMGPRVAGRAE
jgi:hypothetical protein